jgi:hypothetical protein
MGPSQIGESFIVSIGTQENLGDHEKTSRPESGSHEQYNDVEEFVRIHSSNAAR